MIHELKIKECYWKDVWNGRKTFEIRKNDRDFKVGDIIHFKPIYENGDLIELDPSTDEKYNRYAITYIFNGGEYGISKDYCVLSIRQVVAFESAGTPMNRVRDLISCLANSPLDNILITEVDEDKKTYYECQNVLRGGGTNQGLTYLDIRTNEEMSEPE